MSAVIAIDPHDLAHLRAPGAFLLLRRRPHGRARVLAAGGGDPVAAGLSASVWARALAQGCDEAVLIPCPCPRRRKALVAGLARLAAP